MKPNEKTSGLARTIASPRGCVAFSALDSVNWVASKLKKLFAMHKLSFGQLVSAKLIKSGGSLHLGGNKNLS